MPQNNFEDSSLELQRMSELLNKFNSDTGTSTRNMDLLAKAQADLDKQEKKKLAAKKELIRTLEGLSGDFVQIGGALGTSEGSMKALNPVIDVTTKVAGSLAAMVPFVGSALKSLAEGAGEVAKFMVDSFERAYGSYEKLSGSGILTTFEDLSTASRNTKLSYADLERVLSTNSTRVAKLGGTAAEGRKIFESISHATKETSEEFRRLGINAGDFANLQIGMLELQRLSSLNQKNDWAKSTTDSVEYIKNLNVLSALTGVSREELQKKQLDLANDPRYQATILSLEKKNADEIRDLITQLSTIDPAMAEGLKDVIAASGNPLTDTGKSVSYALSEMGIDPVKFANDLRRGNATSAQVMNLLKSRTEKYITRNKFYAAQLNKNDVTTRTFVGFIKLASVKGHDFEKQKEIEIDLQGKTLKDDKSQNSQLAKTANSMYNTQMMIQDLATSSDTMTLVMEKMSTGIEDFVEKLHTSLGNELPPYLKIRKEERQLIKDIDKERKEIIELQKRYENHVAGKRAGAAGVVGKELEQKRGSLKQKESRLGEINSAKNAPLTIDGEDSGGGGFTGGGTASPQQVQQTGGSGGIAAIRELISSVESVGGNYNSIFGGRTDTPLTSMTIAQVLQHQANMKARGARSVAAGRYQFMDYTLPEYARKAGFDFNTTMFNAETQDKLADILIREKGYDRYKSGKITAEQFLGNLSQAWAGLPHPAKGGSFYAGDGLNKSHISVEKALAKIKQAKTGGIFSGPESGYLAMLHGTEAVLSSDAQQDVSKRSLPGTVGESSSSDESLDELIKMITRKVDTMITVVDSGMSKQQKIIKSSVY